VIAVLGRHAPPDEAVALRALAAGPLAAPEATFRRLGRCLLGMATHPDFADSTISADGDIIAVLTGRIDNAPDGSPLQQRLQQRLDALEQTEQQVENELAPLRAQARVDHDNRRAHCLRALI